MLDHLTDLYLPGALTIWCALAFALAALWGYAQALRGDEESRAFGRRAYTFFAVAILLAAVVMIVALLRRDFRIEYIFQYSGMELPINYQFAAFWAGQKGSFLIWLLWGALLGVPLARSAGKDEPPVMLVYTLTVVGLLFILVRENPFVMLGEAPLDGKGLNPLLQDDWMVIHPPIMFIGYAASAIPFAFAVAAMWRRDYSNWAKRAFPWALAGFLVLGTAILMGGYWAYKTLGWGGYWGWDPVENASLIPWLFGTALIHGLHLERTQKRYRRANLVLACLVFLSVLYGTFLTRSGVLADFSVHSFVDLGISGWLIGLMVFFGGGALYLLITRLPGVATRPNADPFLSRGTFMVLSTIVVLAAAVLVTLGTSAPILTGFFMETPAQVGPSFYNASNFPLAVLVALLLAMVPYLTWRGNSEVELLKKLIPGAVAAVLITVGAAVVAVRDPFHLFFIFLAALALTTNLHKTVMLARTGGLKAAGGYLSHVGVGIMLLGFLSSSAYDFSSKVTLEQGVPTQVGDMTVTFNRFIDRGVLPAECGNRECMEVEVTRADGKSYLAYPRMFVNQRTRQTMVHPDVKTTLLRDFYISPIEFEPGTPAGGARTVELTAGQEADLGGSTVRFLGFDMDTVAHAQAQLASGGPVTVGANVEVVRDGQTHRITPLYQFDSTGQVQTPGQPVAGGVVYLAGIDATAGAVRLYLEGLTPGAPEVLSKLSIDVTKKPLIILVWGGLWVVLIGGLLSTFLRLRQALKVDRSEPAAAE